MRRACKKLMMMVSEKLGTEQQILVRGSEQMECGDPAMMQGGAFLPVFSIVPKHWIAKVHEYKWVWT